MAFEKTVSAPLFSRPKTALPTKIYGRGPLQEPEPELRRNSNKLALCWAPTRERQFGNRHTPIYNIYTLKPLVTWNVVFSYLVSVLHHYRSPEAIYAVVFRDSRRYARCMHALQASAWAVDPLISLCIWYAVLPRPAWYYNIHPAMIHQWYHQFVQCRPCIC